MKKFDQSKEERDFELEKIKIETQSKIETLKDDNQVKEVNRQELEEFRAFLRNLLMHASIGTALGGVATTVGEPQNLLIASVAGWSFGEFFFKMLPITFPVFICGLITCYLIEKLSVFSYGIELPNHIREILYDYDVEQTSKRTRSQNMQILTQSLIALVLVFSLAFGFATPGLIGLMIIVLLTAFNGVIEEPKIG